MKRYRVRDNAKSPHRERVDVHERTYGRGVAVVSWTSEMLCYGESHKGTTRMTSAQPELPLVIAHRVPVIDSLI